MISDVLSKVSEEIKAEMKTLPLEGSPLATGGKPTELQNRLQKLIEEMDDIRSTLKSEKLPGAQILKGNYDTKV